MSQPVVADAETLERLRNRSSETANDIRAAFRELDEKVTELTTPPFGGLIGASGDALRRVEGEIAAQMQQALAALDRLSDWVGQTNSSISGADQEGAGSIASALGG